jgi:hypothetical protein
MGEKKKTLHQSCFEVIGTKIHDDNLTILCVRRGQKADSECLGPLWTSFRNFKNSARDLKGYPNPLLVPMLNLFKT